MLEALAAGLFRTSLTTILQNPAPGRPLPVPPPWARTLEFAYPSQAGHYPLHILVVLLLIAQPDKGDPGYKFAISPFSQDVWYIDDATTYGTFLLSQTSSVP